MYIVVIGGTGLIGSKLVTTLREQGHDVVAALQEPGVDSITDKGLTDALTGAAVVIDLSAPPFSEDAAAMAPFTTSTRILLDYEAAAGVRHHVALSAVGTDRLVESGYFRTKCAQEQLIKASSIPYSIVRSAQLFESLGRIADAATHGAAVRVPPALVQPVAADDVVRTVAEIAVAAPLNGMIEIGGPEPFYLDGLLQRVLGARNDSREVIADAHARYFGAAVGERDLVAGDEAELGEVRFDDWLRHATFGCAGANGANGACAGASHTGSIKGATIEGAASEGAPLKAHEFRVSDVPPGSVLLLGDVAVFSVAGGFCATQAMCTHKAGPLSEGAVDDTTVTCPLHGSRFDIWTGAVLRGPAKAPLKTYPVIIDGDIGRVDVAQTRAAASSLTGVCTRHRHG